MTRTQIVRMIADELGRAYAKHGAEEWGRHEFYAILKEEVDELWDHIKADSPQKEVVKESIQVAAMVFRYLERGDRNLVDGCRWRAPRLDSNKGNKARKFNRAVSVEMGH